MVGEVQVDEVVQVSDGSLYGMALFRSLSEHDQAELAKSAQRREHQRGELLWEVGEEADSVYLVTAGRARLYRLTHSGHAIALHDLQAGDMLGLVYVERSLLHQSIARALLDGTVVYTFPRQQLLRLVEAHVTFAAYALAQLWRWLNEAHQRVEELTCEDVPTRLARTLGRLALLSRDHVVTATHEELAALVGTTRERVTKVLAEFRASGLIVSERYRRGIVVRDLAGLLAL